MYILTPENKAFDTIRIPNSSSTLYHCILDYSDHNDVDYKFPPTVFIEDFPKASVELMIGEYRIQVPYNWCVLLGDRDFGELEIMPIKNFHGRNFHIFAFNPINGYRPEYLPIEVINIYQEVRWCIPTTKANHMLAVPLHGGEQPLCGFFVDEKNKLPDVLDIRQLF